MDLLYERSRVNNSTKKNQQQQQEEEADEVKPKKLYVQKYHDKSAANVLYEAVLIAGKPYFVSQEWD